jgi:hypothetical protein
VGLLYLTVGYVLLMRRVGPTMHQLVSPRFISQVQRRLVKTQSQQGSGCITAGHFTGLRYPMTRQQEGKASRRSQNIAHSPLNMVPQGRRDLFVAFPSVVKLACGWQLLCQVSLDRPAAYLQYLCSNQWVDGCYSSDLAWVAVRLCWFWFIFSATAPVPRD